MVVPARARCLLEQQSLCKSAVCSVEKCLPSAGRQADLAPLGRAGLVCNTGGKPAFFPPCLLPSTQELLSCASLWNRWHFG